jgi:NitT/TauT family transport system substrate-binding protein
MSRKLGLKILFACFILLTAANDAQARKVQVAVATLSQSVLPLVVAQERGYYRAEDLDVQLILMPASVANLALIGANVDFISSGGSAITAILHGAPLRFVFVSFNRPMHWLFSRPEIRDVKGLKGKRIGVSAVGGSIHFLLSEVLKKHGLDGSRDATVFSAGTLEQRRAVVENPSRLRENIQPSP